MQVHVEVVERVQLGGLRIISRKRGIQHYRIGRSKVGSKSGLRLVPNTQSGWMNMTGEFGWNKLWAPEESLAWSNALLHCFCMQVSPRQGELMLGMEVDSTSCNPYGNCVHICSIANARLLYYWRWKKNDKWTMKISVLAVIVLYQFSAWINS